MSFKHLSAFYFSLTLGAGSVSAECTHPSQWGPEDIYGRSRDVNLLLAPSC
jgi:hypothetical protein